jgi:putative endonuclease
MTPDAAPRRNNKRGDRGTPGRDNAESTKPDNQNPGNRQPNDRQRGDRRPRPLRGPDEAQRRTAFRFGLSAESRAAAFLIAKGYRILARRFRTPLGEIDIVARRRDMLVFVEVKARDNFEEAAEAIGIRQQNRIIGAAQLWLAAHPEDAMRDMRFDAILVIPGRLPHHLPAAFDASS